MCTPGLLYINNIYKVDIQLPKSFSTCKLLALWAQQLFVVGNYRLLNSIPGSYSLDIGSILTLSPHFKIFKKKSFQATTKLSLGSETPNQMPLQLPLFQFN